MNSLQSEHQVSSEKYLRLKWWSESVAKESSKGLVTEPTFNSRFRTASLMVDGECDKLVEVVGVMAGDREEVEGRDRARVGEDFDKDIWPSSSDDGSMLGARHAG